MRERVKPAADQDAGVSDDVLSVLSVVAFFVVASAERAFARCQ
jgi:hypothetical protein